MFFDHWHNLYRPHSNILSTFLWTCKCPVVSCLPSELSLNCDPHVLCSLPLGKQPACAGCICSLPGWVVPVFPFVAELLFLSRHLCENIQTTSFETYVENRQRVKTVMGRDSWADNVISQILVSLGNETEKKGLIASGEEDRKLPHWPIMALFSCNVVYLPYWWALYQDLSSEVFGCLWCCSVLQ